MPSAFDVLASDHEQVKRLLSQFEAAPAASGTNDSLLAARKKMAETLVIAESKHEAVEEMYFWPTVRERRDTGQDQRPGHGERQQAADREARDWARQTGYRPAANQRRHEPMPASRDDDPRQEAVVRNEEHAGDHEQARPSPRAPSRRPGRDKARDDRE